MKKFKQVVMEWGAPVLALAVPVFAFAQAPQPPVVAPQPVYTTTTNVTGLFCIIINWIFWLLIVLTIIFVLIAAFRYLTAAGDPEKVKKAGQTLLYAAIAVIIALVAKGLPLLVSSFVGGGLGSTGC